jgi:hypothetical protein
MGGDQSPVGSVGRRLRRAIGGRLRAVVDASLTEQLAPLLASMDDLRHQMDHLRLLVEGPGDGDGVGLVRLARANELEIRAVQQRLDECLAFLRVQHEAVRDTLERLAPDGPDSG